MREDQSSSEDEPLVEVIAAEIIQRQRAGEKPTVEEYCQRYPEHADDLRAFLPAILVVEGLKPSSDDDSGTFGSQVEIDGKRAEAIGDYRILKEIGRGGMGVVYEAEQQSLGRRVALKVLPRSAAGDEKSLARFQREARAAAKMHHTNIVPVFEVGQDQEHVFYAMQLIQGQGLDLVIDDLKQLRADSMETRKRKPDSVENLALSLVSGHFRHEKLLDSDDAPREQFTSGEGTAYEETVLSASGSTASVVLPGQSELSSAERDRKAYFHSVAQIGLQTARALSYAHARGIIHRDIKPSNLLLDTTGVVWVTDFGLAKTSDAGLTHTGDILGTIRYMSPERFKGQCDVRADVYSLGLTLFELVTLKPAFESPDRLKLIDLVTKTEIPSPRSLEPRIPRDLETIILKASEKDPKRRYQSADDLAEDLQRFVDDEPILARRTTTVERFARWSRRNPWLATAMSVAVLALVAVAGISTYSAAELKSKQDEQNTLISNLQSTQRELDEKNAENTKKISENQQLIDEILITNGDLLAEKGQLFDAIHWYLKSVIQSPGQNPIARNLIAISAQKVPQLLLEVYLPRSDARRVYQEKIRDLAQQQVREREKNGNPAIPIIDPEQRKYLVRATVGRHLVDGLVHTPREGELLTLIDDYLDGSNFRQSMRFWDVSREEWTGLTLDNFEMITGVDVSPEKKLVAITLFHVETTGETVPTTFSGVNPLLKYSVRTEIRHLESGRVLFESEREWTTHNPPVILQLQPVKFLDKGSRLLHMDCGLEEIRLRVIDCESYQIEERQINFDIDQLRRFSRGSWMQISQDGRSLILVSLPLRDALRFRTKRPVDPGSVAIYDLETGKRVGQQISFDKGAPLIIADDASRVAIVAGTGGQQQIEIYDVFTGQQTGESIPLPDSLLTPARLLSVSTDRSHIIATYSGPSTFRGERYQADRPDAPSESRTVRSYVQVYDLVSGRALVPPVAAFGNVYSAIFSSRERKLTVRDDYGIRVWTLPNMTLKPVLLPNLGPTGRYTTFSNRSNLTQANSPGLMSTLDDGRFAMLQSTEKNKVRLTMWDAQSGQLVSDQTHSIAGTIFPTLRFSPDGKYLLGQVYSVGNETGETQQEGPRVRHTRCWRTDPFKELTEPISLKQNENVDAISPDGDWIATIGQLEQPGGVPRRGGAQIRSMLLQEANEKQLQFQVQLVNRRTGERRDVPGGFDLEADTTKPEIEFSGDGERLYVRRGAIVQICDLSEASIATTGFTLVNTDQSKTIRSIPNGIPSSERDTLWAINHDGTMIADVIENSSVQIRLVESNRMVGDLLVHPALITAVCFDSQAGTVVTACADGLIRQWSLPTTWTGTPEEIRKRVEEHTGLQIKENGTVELKRMVQEQRPGALWRNTFAGSETGLNPTQQTALDWRSAEKWDEADEALKTWQESEPANTLPSLLRFRGLEQQGSRDEIESLCEALIPRVGEKTVRAWHNLELDRNRSRVSPGLGPGTSRVNELTRELAQSIINLDRSAVPFVMAKAYETLWRFEEAANSIDEDVGIRPNLAFIHYYRAHLMARMGRWNEALQSRLEVMRLEPDDHNHYFKVLAYYLFLEQENHEKFWQVWRKMRDKWADAEDVKRAAEKLAKPALILGQPGPELEQAIQLADRAYEKREGNFLPFDVQAKGLVDLRRGEIALASGNSEDARDLFEEALSHTRECLDLFANTNIKVSLALGKFQESIILHHLDRREEALTAYLDGVDQHNFDLRSLRLSQTAVFTDWLLNETLRREAAKLLGSAVPQSRIAVPDTTTWKTIFADKFDQTDSKFQPSWRVSDGDWAIEAGAARGTFSGEPYSGELLKTSLDLDFELPETFEIQYETWWPQAALSELKLLPSLTSDDMQSAYSGQSDYTVGLSGFEFNARQVLTWAGKGFHLIDYFPIGNHWMNADEELELEPDQKYTVRVIQQSNYVVCFVNDGSGEVELFNERLSGPRGKFVRLFGIGTTGDSVYFDNLIIRAPESE